MLKKIENWRLYCRIVAAACLTMFSSKEPGSGNSEQMFCPLHKPTPSSCLPPPPPLPFPKTVFIPRRHHIHGSSKQPRYPLYHIGRVVPTHSHMSIDATTEHCLRLFDPYFLYSVFLTCILISTQTKFYFEQFYAFPVLPKYLIFRFCGASRSHLEFSKWEYFRVISITAYLAIV